METTAAGAALGPWPRWATDSSEGLWEEASVIQVLRQGIARLHQAGMRVDVERIGARIGLPMTTGAVPVEVPASGLWNLDGPQEG